MSLDGIDDVPALPGNAAPAGVDLGTAIVLPPGGQVFYVRGNGTATTNYSYDPPGLQDRLIASVAKAGTYTVANRGDTIVALPGHTETIAVADGWSTLTAGTKVLGLGTGNNRPTVTWSATASSLLLNDANVTIDNMRLLLAPAAGSVTVTAAITASAAGVTVRRCYIEVGTTAARLTTTAITVAAGADDFRLNGNEIWGDILAAVTDCVKVTGAVSRLKVYANDIQVATTANANGPLSFTAAAVDIQVKNNWIVNKKAGSTSAVTGFAALGGMMSDNYLGIAAAGAATAIVTPGNVYQVQNFLCQPGKNGILGTDGGAST